MSGGISRTFGVTFLASPLGEGERTEVRGSKRATRNCPENPHLPPLPFEGERRPFNVQRVCVLLARPLKKWNQLPLP